jgi:hypothetical protein
MSAPHPPSESSDPARWAGGYVRPVFVSRTDATGAKRSAGVRRPEAPILDAHSHALPSLRDRNVRWMIALTLCLQLLAWVRVDGYQLADSVEFMERALVFVRGERLIDAGAIRPFGFSFALVPFFALADWLGMQDLRPVVWAIVLLQMALGCALVYRCMRLGARLAGKSGAIAGGFLVATNPVFLQYSTQPVSDIAAGVCVAIALEHLIERGTFRRGLVGGLWLGIAFMVAYKTLLVSLAVLPFLFLRDRFKHSATWRGVLTGVGAGLLVQSCLDGLMYGKFGASVITYVAANSGTILTSNVYRLYLKTNWQPLLTISTFLYQTQQDVLGIEWKPSGTPEARALQSPFFYVLQLPTMLVWPAIAAGALGIARSVLRPNWKSTLLAGVFLLCVYLMSHKGAKDFRLWLALTPLFVPMCAYGWEWFAGSALMRSPARRAWIATTAVTATIVLALSALLAVNVRHFGGYWRAIDYVGAMARASYPQRARAAHALGPHGEPERWRVGSAYNWAVFLRQSPLLEVVKLPWQLNMWKQYEKWEGQGVKEHADDMAEIETLDVLLVHLPILSNNLDLMAWVNAHFEVAAAFYDQATYEEIGPLFVFVRRTGSRDARTLWDVGRGAQTERIIADRELGHPMDFVRDITRDPGIEGERLELLGVEYRAVPPDDLGWITYHWRARTPLVHDYAILDRITSPDERNVWENNHQPAYGALPMTSFVPGEVVSESYVVVAAAQPFKPQGRYRPVGGGYRRGELIPARVWMKLEAYAPDPAPDGTQPLIGALAPARPGGAKPIRGPDEPDEKGAQETPDGIQFSIDGWVRVGGFFMPVPAKAKLPDDGRPVLD